MTIKGALFVVGLGARLKQARKAAGLRQKDVARVLNVAPTTVSSWETGHRDPDTATLGRLGTLYGVSVGWLLGTPSRADAAGELREAYSKAIDLDNLPPEAQRFLDAVLFDQARGRSLTREEWDLLYRIVITWKDAREGAHGGGEES